MRGCTTSRISRWKSRTTSSSSSRASPARANRRWPSTRSSPRGSAATSRASRPTPGSSSGRSDKPDVDIITGIAPAIAIEQKVNTRNPRSTVGTTTEIYDYLKLLFARIGHTFSPVSGQEVRCYSVDDVAAYILAHGEGRPRRRSRRRWTLGEGQGIIEKLTLLLSDGLMRVWTTGATRLIEDLLPGIDRDDPGRRDLGGRRPHARRRGRGYADPHAGLRGPRVLLRRGDLPDHHRRGRHGVLVALRGRRHRVRAPLGTPFQLQQPAGGLSPVRGVRQGDRHRRGPGDPRQEQDHLRGRRGLLARRDDAQVEGAAGGERLQVRFPDPHAVPRTDARAETPAVARQRIFPRAGRLFRLHRLGTAQDSVPRDESPLYGQDHLPRMRRQPPAQGGALREAWAARPSPTWW